MNDAGLNMIVGARSGKYSNMEIDDIMYFTRALSASEIANMYRNASCDFDSKSIVYRYGFQGQERDDEVKGAGNSYNYKYRMHDPRLGRFFTVDPLSPEYPELTPYQFSSNNTTWFVEIEGLEGKPSEMNFDKLKFNYPGSLGTNYGQEIIKKNPSLAPYAGQNSCAIRMSYCMNKSDYIIPSSAETPKDVKVQTGHHEDDIGNFVLLATSFKNLMADNEAPTYVSPVLDSEEKVNQMEEDLSEYIGFEGIIVFVSRDGASGSYGATGHVDLIEQSWGDFTVYSMGVDLVDYAKKKIYAGLQVYLWEVGTSENAELWDFFIELEHAKRIRKQRGS